MNKMRRTPSPHEASVESAEVAALAAFRSEEPVRRRDPFDGTSIQRLIAEEASARATRQRGGPRSWLERWLRSAPRPALAGAALSLALLATGIPFATLQPSVGSELRTDPAAVMSEAPRTESIEGGAADVGNVGPSFASVAETPWLLVAGAVGLVASLLAAESVRRRRRA
jgi:hypothetical protein